MKRAKLYQCTVGPICGGVVVYGNKITEAPPVWHSWIGRAWTSFVSYYGRKLRVTDVKDGGELTTTRSVMLPDDLTWRFRF